MKSRARSLCLASALLVAGSTAMPSTAAAKPKCVGNDAGSFVCFVSRSDNFKLTDTSHNEMAAGVYWRTDYGRVGVCLNTLGKGTTFTCKYDMREGHEVTFWAVDVDTPTNTYKHWSADARATV
jgi:hypothetical protein